VNNIKLEDHSFQTGSQQSYVGGSKMNTTDEKLMRLALEALVEAYKDKDIWPTIIRALRARLEHDDSPDDYGRPLGYGGKE
jgi:hypothetical protein